MEAELLAKRGLMATEQGYRWRSDPRLRSASALRASDAQAIDFLCNIKCPVMLMVGQDSGEMVQRMQQKYQQHYANLVATSIPGGHHCHMTNSQQTAELLLTFLQQ